MPHTSFTRFLIVAIAAVMAGTVLADYPLGEGLGLSIFVLAALLMWRAMRAAPPYDDRAFHRTLPVTWRRAFWWTAWPGLAALALAVLGIAVYCGYQGFGWRTCLFAILGGCIPGLGTISACGVAAAAATDRTMAKGWSWAAVFLPGGIWAALYHGMISGIFSSLGLGLVGWRFPLVMVASLIYPVAWWVAGAVRHKRWGLILAGSATAALPLIESLEQGVKLPIDRHLEPVAQIPGLEVDTQVFERSSAKRISAGDAFRISGLKEGEYLVGMFSVKGVSISLSSPGVDESDVSDSRGPYNGPFHASLRADGSLAWGEEAKLEAIRPWLPEGVTLVPKLRNPGDREDEALALPENGPEREFYLNELRSANWSCRLWHYRFGSPIAVMDAFASSRVKLPAGGSLRLETLHDDVSGDDVLDVTLREDRRWVNGDPWFHLLPQDRGRGNPLCLLAVVDEKRKEAWLTYIGRDFNDSTYPMAMESLLPGEQIVHLRSGPSEWREGLPHLQGSKLYVFLPEEEGLASVNEKSAH